MPGTTFNAYADVPAFTALAPGATYADLLGGGPAGTPGATVTNAATAAGVTSLPVVSSAYVSAGQPVYLLDGPLSELVFADSVTPAPDGTHIKLSGTGTANAHGANVSVSTPGTRGALADLIRVASAILENYCQQGTPSDRGLFQVARTERLRMPTTRAMIDPWGSVTARPHWFPVVSVASLAIEYAPGSSIALDPTQIEYEANGQAFRMPYTAILSGQKVSPVYYDSPPVSRGGQAWLAITYTAGFTWAALPYDIVQACCLATQELLGYRMNPTGAAMVRQGDTMIEQRLRGSGGKESTTDGLFLSQAKLLMQPYRARFI